MVIWLCDVEGLCMQEAAERLGSSVSAVKTSHCRANQLVLKAAKRIFDREQFVLPNREMCRAIVSTYQKKPAEVSYLGNKSEKQYRDPRMQIRRGSGLGYRVAHLVVGCLKSP